MKYVPLTLIVGTILSSTVEAQTATSQVSGFSALMTLASARGHSVTAASFQNLKAGTATYADMLRLLRVSPDVLSNLLTYGNRPAPVLLVTRAVLESATGKRFTDSAVAALIMANPQLAVTSLSDLIALISNPAAIALANSAADAMTTPVTPRGGGS